MGRIALNIIRTSGDAIQDRPLAEAGGKGLFTKEIDAALIAGEIDAAVHSAKDLPSRSPEGVAVAAFLPREDVRDALVSSYADTIEAAERGAVRRGLAAPSGPGFAPTARPQAGAVARQRRDPAAQGRVGSGRRDPARSCRPEAAGPRPSRARRARDRCVPAGRRPGRHRDHCAQRRRSRASSARAGLGRRDIRGACRRTRVLGRLGGSCRAPIAGLARFEAGRLRFKGEALRLDGSERFEVAAEGAAEDARRIGREAGRDLARRLPADVVASGG